MVNSRLVIMHNSILDVTLLSASVIRGIRRVHFLGRVRERIPIFSALSASCSLLQYNTPSSRWPSGRVQFAQQLPNKPCAAVVVSKDFLQGLTPECRGKSPGARGHHHSGSCLKGRASSCKVAATCWSTRGPLRRLSPEARRDVLRVALRGAAPRSHLWGSPPTTLATGRACLTTAATTKPRKCPQQSLSTFALESERLKQILLGGTRTRTTNLSGNTATSRGFTGTQDLISDRPNHSPKH